MKFRSKAPLRLGFAGGGTDVSPYYDNYGGIVLNATLNLYAHCTIKITNNNKIVFHALDQKEHFETDSCSELTLDGQMDLYKGIYNRIVKQFNGNKPLSFELITYSDVPSGSGLGGSSTMVVAIIQAFCEWLNLPLGEYEISHLAYEIERLEIGIVGGKQDQYAATFGGFNLMEFYADDKVIVNPLRVKNWIINEFESSIVLYFTGIRRSASIIEEEKQNAMQKVSKTLEAMHDVKEDAKLMKEYLLKGDVKSFAKVLGKSWESKKNMAQSVSNLEIDKVLDIAIKSGAYSGKVSGAGGGGFMFFIVDPVKKFALVEALNSCDGQVINFNFSKEGSTAWRI